MQSDAILQWISTHQEDMLVNAASSVPLFLIETVVLVLTVPLLVTFINEHRTKRLRGELLGDMVQSFLKSITVADRVALQLIQEKSKTEVVQKPSVLVQEIEGQRGRIANEMPIYASVLNPAELRLAIRFFRVMGTLLDQLEDQCKPPPLFRFDSSREFLEFDKVLAEVRRVRDKRTGQPFEFYEIESHLEYSKRIDRNIEEITLAAAEARGVPRDELLRARQSFNEYIRERVAARLGQGKDVLPDRKQEPRSDSGVTEAGQVTKCAEKSAPSENDQAGDAQIGTVQGGHSTPG